MVTDKPAYDQLIDYLNSNKSIFHNDQPPPANLPSIENLMEQEISDQVIQLCTQHEALETNHRSIIIREIDGIVYDIQQVLDEYWQQPATPEQSEFIHDFATLIKNIFDSEIASLLD